MTQSFTVDQLLDSLPEVVDVLRDPRNHNGELRPHLTDSADAEFVALWRCCELVDLDPTGIPCWSPGGVLRGLSTRTTATHVGWMIADLMDRMPLDSSQIHALLWRARLRSMGCSNQVASVMLAVRDRAIEDDFAEFRDCDAAVAS